MSEYLVVTGMSGAGRSTAGATLEDLGWFVIDNMPSTLISKVAELVDGSGSELERVALVVGRGGGDFDDLLPAIDALRAGRNRVRILFLDAADDVLVRRFEGTRRRHPQAARGVEESITDERRILQDVRDPGRPGGGHRGAERQPAPDPADGGLRERGARGDHAHLDPLLRLQARGAPRRRPGVRLPLPPQPLLGRGAAATAGLDAPVREFVLGRPESTAFLEQAGRPV